MLRLFQIVEEYQKRKTGLIGWSFNQDASLQNQQRRPSIDSIKPA